MTDQLTARERVRRALAHQEPDRVPIDLGGHSASSMAPLAYANLCQHLGFEYPKQVRLMSKPFQIALLEENVLQALGSDCRPLIAPQIITHGPVAQESGELIDEWGIKWHRPESSLYYEVAQHPLAGMNVDDLEHYPWPDPHAASRTEGLREEAERLATTGYAIIGIPSSLNMFERAMFLRGYEQILVDLALDKPFVHALFKRLLEFNLIVYEEFIRAAMPHLDAIRTADDLGGTSAPMISPRMYREMLKPYHREWFSHIKRLTSASIIFHSDGALFPLLPDLVEAGIDALNPVQVFAKGMDTKRLKHEFGDELSFWGGVDSINILPRGSRQDVELEVRQRIEELGPGGGFVLAGIHNLQPDVPPENVMAMVEAAHRFGRYPIAGHHD